MWMYWYPPSDRLLSIYQLGSALTWCRRTSLNDCKKHYKQSLHSFAWLIAKVKVIRSSLQRLHDRDAALVWEDGAIPLSVSDRLHRPVDLLNHFLFGVVSDSGFLPAKLARSSLAGQCPSSGTSPHHRTLREWCGFWVLEAWARRIPRLSWAGWWFRPCLSKNRLCCNSSVPSRPDCIHILVVVRKVVVEPINHSLESYTLHAECNAASRGVLPRTA